MSAFFPQAAFRAQLGQDNQAATTTPTPTTKAVARARALLGERQTLAQAPAFAGSIGAHAAALAGTAAAAYLQATVEVDAESGDEDDKRASLHAELADVQARAYAILDARARLQQQQTPRQQQLRDTIAGTTSSLDWSRRHAWCRNRVSTADDDDISRNMDALCGAESAVGYRAALSRLPVDGVPFLRVPVSWLVGVRGHDAETSSSAGRGLRHAASRDKTEKQDSKDIGRDRILVNGVMHDGAEESYTAILESVQEACRRAHAEHHRLPPREAETGAGGGGGRKFDSGGGDDEDGGGDDDGDDEDGDDDDGDDDDGGDGGDDDSGDDGGDDGGDDDAGAGAALQALFGGAETHCSDFDKLARQLIRAANRTESGGDAWETIECIVRHPEFSLIVPLSKKAAPLSVHVDFGPYTALLPKGKISQASRGKATSLSWEYGVRAVVRASTSYAICDGDMEAAGTAQPSNLGGRSTYNGLDCWATITGTFERTIVAPLVPVAGGRAPAATTLSSAPRWQIGAPDLSDRGRISLALGPPV